MRRSTKSYKIPNDVMLPHLKAMTKEIGKCADNFTTYEFEKLREKCGHQYAGTPTDDVRRQAVNLRKRGVVGRVGDEPDDDVEGSAYEYFASDPERLRWYSEVYLRSPHWLAFRAKVLEYWGHRCALCNARGVLSAHHRHYESLGHESITDALALCQPCHEWADNRRRKVKRAEPRKSRINSEANMQLFV